MFTRLVKRSLKPLGRTFCTATPTLSPQSLRTLLYRELQRKAEETGRSPLSSFYKDRQELEALMREFQNHSSLENYEKVLEKMCDMNLFDDAHYLHRNQNRMFTIESLKGPAYVEVLKRTKPGVESMQSTLTQKRIGFLNTLLTWSLFFILIEFYSANSKGDGDESNPLSLINKFSNNSEIKNVTTKFADVQGIDEFKEELEDIVDFLKNGQKYRDAGAYIPKGVLLVGPPGTGKTLLAKAIAGEAGCSFFYKSGSEFDEVFVGIGAKRVRQLFQQAQKKAPAIIFIDEIDALTASRTGFESSNRRQTINQLLEQMDGFKQLENVVVIGATNMPDKIDKAILRPGRFDKIINVPYPDRQGRKEIFDLYLSKVKYDKDNVDLDTIVKATTGFTGASIRNMVNIAVLNAIKEGRDKANHLDFEHALDRIRMGVGRKHMMITEQERLMTAYHEGGHTLVNLLTHSAMPLHKVTILPRGAALGFTAMLPQQDAFYMNRGELISQVQIALGGRVAEELVFGNEDVTTGCSSDMDKATDLVFKLLREYGMETGYLLSRAKDDLSESYNSLIDKQAQKLLIEQLEITRRLLKVNRPKLDLLAEELVKKETLSRSEIEKLLNLTPQADST